MVVIFYYCSLDNDMCQRRNVVLLIKMFIYSEMNFGNLLSQHFIVKCRTKCKYSALHFTLQTVTLFKFKYPLFWTLLKYSAVTVNYKRYLSIELCRRYGIRHEKVPDWRIPTNISVSYAFCSRIKLRPIFIYVRSLCLHWRTSWSFNHYYQVSMIRIC